MNAGCLNMCTTLLHGGCWQLPSACKSSPPGFLFANIFWSSDLMSNAAIYQLYFAKVEVRSLDESTATSHTFPTVDMVTAMEHSQVGRYLATLESRDQLTFVRVYLNWWSPEAASQPMRARVPGLTPSLQVGRTKVFVVV